MLEKHIKYDEIYKLNKMSGENGWHSKNNDLEISEWAKLLLTLSQKTSGKLIELGCGAGNISVGLSDWGFEVVGVDVSPTAIEWAKKRFTELNKYATFLLSNVSNLEIFRSESFDIALDSLCLHCLIGDDRLKTLSEVHRVLKTDGNFLIISMCGDPRNKTLKPHFNPVTRYIEFENTPECYLGLADDIIEELLNANFEIKYHQIIEGNDEIGDQDMLLVIAKKIKA